jgi:hypothetical protein
MPRSSRLMPLVTARALVAIKQNVTYGIAHPEQAGEMLALIIKDAQRGLEALAMSEKPS